MLDSVTKRKIDSARQILVGKVPDPKAQVEQITTALVYKFMDDMDKESEELGGEARFFTNDFSEYSWTKLMDNRLSGQERLNLYADAISKMSKNPHIPQLFRDIFKGAFLPFRDPRTLSLFLKEINEFNYDHSENLGNAFEYLLSILGSQGDAGQFRTPRHIIDFIVEAINPKKNETILDPACGTAGFLISAYKHILKTNSSNFKPEEEKAEDKIVQGETATETIIEEKNRYSGDLLSPDDKRKLTKNIAGYDISPDMVKLALVNLYLHGFSDPKIFEYDTLSSDKRWDEHFDVILANPPFMTPKGGIVPHKRFSIQAKRAEVLFVDYIAEHLSIKGRAGIIVPEGIIFQSANAYKNLRKNLIENWGLYAVVSLPSGVFQPYSGVKTSILLMDRELAKRSKEILFLKVENDGFDLGAQRRKIDKNDLLECLKVLGSWKKDQTVDEHSKIAFAVDKAKIAENGDYNLTGDRYREAVDYSNAKWEMVKLGELEEQEKIQFLRGQGISKKDILENGQNKCIHYGEIYTLYQPIIKNVISSTNFEGKIFSKKGDVLIPSTTTADAMGIAVARSLNEDNVILGGDINIIRTENKFILSDYLALLISNSPLKNELATYAKGVNILHISNSDIRNLKIPLPPLSIQEQIVAEIEQYQKVIDGAKQVVENWKPHFRIDPGWEMAELGDIGKVSMCKRVFKDQTLDKGDVPFYKIGTFGRTPDAFIKQELFDEYKSKFSYPKKGEILISTSGTIGKTVVFDGEPAYFQDSNIVWIKNNERKVLNKYLNLIYQNINWMPAKGGTIARLYNKIIEETKISVPPLEIQEQIVAEIEAEQQIVEANKSLIEKIEKKVEAKIGEVWGDEI